MSTSQGWSCLCALLGAPARISLRSFYAEDFRTSNFHRHNFDDISMIVIIIHIIIMLLLRSG